MQKKTRTKENLHHAQLAECSNREPVVLVVFIISIPRRIEYTTSLSLEYVIVIQYDKMLELCGKTPSKWERSKKQREQIN